MSIQVINVGTGPNDGTGDTPRVAFEKINDNFTELDGASSSFQQSHSDLTLTPSATAFIITTTAVTVTGDAGGNTILTILGGTPGLVLTLIFTDIRVTITDTPDNTANTINLSAPWTSSVNSTLSLVYNGTKWFEVARSVNTSTAEDILGLEQGGELGLEQGGELGMEE